MTVTYTRGVKWPLTAMAILLVFAFLVGKRGINGTIDLGQDVLNKVGDGSVTVAEAAPDEGVETAIALVLTPRPPLGQRAGKTMNVLIWDEIGTPIGDICVQLRESGAEVHTQNTNWTEGKSSLNFNTIPIGTTLSLYIDPTNHSNPLLNEPNIFDFITDSSMYGETFCFKRTNQLDPTGQKPIYEWIEDCQKPNTVATLPTREGEIGSSPNRTLFESPLYLRELFDENSKGWEEWDDTNTSNEIRGHNFFADGSLHMNLLASADHVIHPTNVPLEKAIKNFGLFLRFSSIVQPQTADSISRLNIKFRMQPDGSHYNLSIDHTNVVSLYYIYIENGETKFETIDNFHSEHYLVEPNLENSINLLVEQDLIRIFINDKEERDINTTMRYVDRPGEISIAIDATAGNVVSYELHELTIKEWFDD